MKLYITKPADKINKIIAQFWLTGNDIKFRLNEISTII